MCGRVGTTLLGCVDSGSPQSKTPCLLRTQKKKLGKVWLGAFPLPLLQPAASLNETLDHMGRMRKADANLNHYDFVFYMGDMGIVVASMETIYRRYGDCGSISIYISLYPLTPIPG